MAMETAGELSTQILEILQDSYSSLDFEAVLPVLNRGLKEVSGKVLLPNLETQADVVTVTGQSYLTLPSDYHKNLHYCYSTTYRRKPKIFSSLRLLLRQFGQLDLSGPVVAVAVRGNQLHYQRIPSTAETLRIYYYALPEELTDEDSLPDCLPEHLVSPLLVHYVCRELFRIREDGIEGAQVNTRYHHDLYTAAVNDLVNFIGPEGVEPFDIVDELHFQDFL